MTTRIRLAIGRLYGRPASDCGSALGWSSCGAATIRPSGRRKPSLTRWEQYRPGAARERTSLRFVD